MSALTDLAAAIDPRITTDKAADLLYAFRNAVRAEALAEARRDPLTHLPNRTAFYEQANQMLNSGTPHAVLFIDLDRFKTINDQHGHAAGDTALHTIGHRLTVWANTAGAVVARLGGDEFTACTPCDSRAYLPNALDVLHADLCEPITHEDQPLKLGASIGLAWHDALLPDMLPRLLRRADEAMYAAKEAGGGWRIADRNAPVYPTINGRRAGRPGTTLNTPETRP